MFELEDDDIKISKKKAEDYDYELALAISKSLYESNQNAILYPEEVQAIIDSKIEAIISTNKLKSEKK